jgi:1,4-dihydroxy-2-naphthoate octaprenyltransferase
VAILGYLNPVVLIFGSAAVAGLLTYTIFKRKWWGGPPWNSWIVALLPIIGRLTSREFGVKDIFNVRDPYALAFVGAVLAVFLGYANFVVMGYFKDISADRKTGYRTFPVVFGWRATTIYSDLLAIGAAFFTVWVILSVGYFSIAGVILYSAALVLSIAAQVGIHRTRDEAEAHGPIANVVRVFILYCMAMIVTLKLSWLPFVVLFYVLFELILKLRPETSQV